MAPFTEDQVLVLPKTTLGSALYLLKSFILVAFMLTHVFGLHMLVRSLSPQNEQLAIYLPAMTGVALALLLGKALFVRSDFMAQLLDNGLRNTPRAPAGRH